MPIPPVNPNDATRRRFLAAVSAAGLGHTLLPGALLALATPGSAQTSGEQPKSAELLKITPEMIEQAAVIAGVTFTAGQRAMMLDSLTSQREDVLEVRKLALPNSVAPALVFDPVPPGTVLDVVKKPAKFSPVPRRVLTRNEDGPVDLEAYCYFTVREWAGLLERRRVTSVELTTMYLARLKRLDPKLHCVITLTEERALKQAAERDAELARDRYRGPLHGIPWGAKDLLAVAGYPTTWGAGGMEAQRFDEDAEVVKRLDAAGAVLIAKLSLGALAQGDLWGAAPGTRTRNPWNVRQGSSGSSAGSASAVAAGCVGFAIGTETLGSISSPSTRCGRLGCGRALAWCRGRGRWRCRGRWTRSARSRGRWRMRRSC